MKKRSKSFPFCSKYLLLENDEGIHKNSLFKFQEWWYFNVLFNDSESQLKDWSVTISLGTFPHTDSLKLVLHDNQDKTYGDMYLKPARILKAKKNGVDVDLDGSTAKGSYPEWKVYAHNKEIDDDEIIVKLKFKANTLPVWLVKNTGLNHTSSIFGYYCVMNCSVEGEVVLNGKKYKVKGVGYHDHTWMPLLKETESEPTKKIIDFNIWDWICIHLDNGWDAFIGKIHSSDRFAFSNLIPGSLCFISKDQKALECKYFPIIYEDFKKSAIPSLKIPTKIHIKALKMNLLNKNILKGPFFLDMYYEVENIKEIIPRDPPTWCQWETTGKVHGFIKNKNKNVKLNGWGLMETTSNV